MYKENSLMRILIKLSIIEEIIYVYIKIFTALLSIIFLASCGKSDSDTKNRTSSNPSKTAESKSVEISDLKFRYIDQRILFIAKVQNSSSKILNGKPCMRLYDKDGFEINKLRGDTVNIESKGSDAINGSGYIESTSIHQIKTIKLYIARFGCVDSPTEAISAVLNTNFEIPERSSADQKNESGAKENLYNTNLFIKVTDEVCSRVTDLTQDYATDIAMQLGVSVSNVRFIKSVGCLIMVDTPASPRKCSISGVFRLKNGEYVATNLWEREDGSYMKIGRCLSAEESRW